MRTSTISFLVAIVVLLCVVLTTAGGLIGHILSQRMADERMTASPAGGGTLGGGINPPVEMNAKPDTKASTPAPSAASTEPLSSDSTQASPTSSAAAVNIEGSPQLTPGIDVSHYQGTVIWPKVKGSGIEFAFVKATGGMRFVDPQFMVNWHSLYELGIARGAYHFLNAEEDPMQQAEHFIATVGQLSGTDLPPVLDIEKTNNEDRTALVRSAQIWLSEVEKRLGKRPIIFSYKDFYQEYLMPELADYPLWVADYEAAEEPEMGRPWHFWQYSSSGKIAGIGTEVDLSVFNGSHNELTDFVEIHVAQASPEMTPAVQIQPPVEPASEPATTEMQTETDIQAASTLSEQTYIVVRGDTLYRIAQRYGVSVQVLQQANHLEHQTVIEVGQELRIPDKNGSD